MSDGASGCISDLRLFFGYDCWSGCHLMPFGYDSSFDTASLEALTAPGVTAAQKSTGANLSFQVTVADIGTNVVIRFEGSVDGDNYFNLAANQVDYTITANGTYGYVLFAPVQFVRVRLVSLSGGTPSVATVLGTI